MKLSALLFPIFLLAPAVHGIQMPPIKGIPFGGMPQQQPQGVPIIEAGISALPFPDEYPLSVLDKINSIDPKSAEKLVDALILFCKENKLTIPAEMLTEAENSLRQLKVYEPNNSAQRKQLELLKIINSNDALAKLFFGTESELLKKIALDTITKNENLLKAVEEKQTPAQMKLCNLGDYALKRIQEEGLVEEENL